MKSQKGILVAQGYCAPQMQQEVNILKEEETYVEVVGTSKDAKSYKINKSSPFIGGYRMSLTVEGRKVV